MACQAHSVEAISVLLDLGADPNITDHRGISPILSALGSINEKNDTILEMMLRHGLDLERMEGDGILLERIRAFDDEGFNILIERYCKNKI